MSQNNGQAGVSVHSENCWYDEGNHSDSRDGAAQSAQSYWTHVNSVGARKEASNFLDRLGKGFTKEFQEKS